MAFSLFNLLCKHFSLVSPSFFREQWPFFDRFCVAGILNALGCLVDFCLKKARYMQSGTKAATLSTSLSLGTHGLTNLFPCTCLLAFFLLFHLYLV